MHGGVTSFQGSRVRDGFLDLEESLGFFLRDGRGQADGTATTTGINN